MAAEEPVQVRVYDDQGRKRPYHEFREDAEAADLGPYQQALLIHQRRSRHARTADESFRAVRTTERIGDVDQEFIRDYYASPNRMDVKGIDTVSKKYKARRVERAAEEFERGGLIEGVVEMDLSGEKGAAGSEGSVAGRFVPQGSGKAEIGGNEVQMQEGRVAAHETLAHELGHALDHRLGGFKTGGLDRFGFSSEVADEDDEFREQVHEASVERRGEFRSSDEYRSAPTEQYADWFVSAVQTPRHTRATREAPWEAAEGHAREKMSHRLEKLAETPLNAAQTDLGNTVNEMMYDDDWNLVPELAGDENLEKRTEIHDLVDEGKREIRRRFEVEGHRERLEERIERRQDDLDEFEASRVTDFASLRLGNIHVEEDPLFEGARRGDLIPGEVVEKLEDRLGSKLDIEGLN